MQIQRGQILAAMNAPRHHGFRAVALNPRHPRGMPFAHGAERTDRIAIRILKQLHRAVDHTLAPDGNISIQHNENVGPIAADHFDGVHGMNHRILHAGAAGCQPRRAVNHLEILRSRQLLNVRTIRRDHRPGQKPGRVRVIERVFDHRPPAQWPEMFSLQSFAAATGQDDSKNIHDIPYGRCQSLHAAHSPLQFQLAAA